MLIDNVVVKIKAGDGGKGVSAFNKNMMSLGPTGGDGGKGGDVYFEGVSDLGALNQFRYKKEIAAKNGGDGRSQFRDGVDAEDVVLRVPVGTVISNLDTSEIQEITKVGQRALAAKSGHGGKGNFKFRSPVNTSPRKFTHGTAGEEFSIKLELKMIADIGIIGFPNAGKSSLLNELTKAQSKVANYPFTTLEPNLGVYYELILADIPGLIEGASEGKGLGIKFLRHIERTKVLFHLVSAESEDLARDYQTVRNELKKYSRELAEKPEYLFLSKSDMATPKEVKNKLEVLKKLNKKAQTLSIHDWESMEKLKKMLNKIKEEK